MVATAIYNLLLLLLFSHDIDICMLTAEQYHRACNLRDIGIINILLLITV